MLKILAIIFYSAMLMLLGVLFFMATLDPHWHARIAVMPIGAAAYHFVKEIAAFAKL